MSLAADLYRARHKVPDAEPGCGFCGREASGGVAGNPVCVGCFDLLVALVERLCACPEICSMFAQAVEIQALPEWGKQDG